MCTIAITLDPLLEKLQDQGSVLGSALNAVSYCDDRQSTDGETARIVSNVETPRASEDGIPALALASIVLEIVRVFIR